MNLELYFASGKRLTDALRCLVQTKHHTTHTVTDLLLASTVAAC